VSTAPGIDALARARVVVFPRERGISASDPSLLRVTVAESFAARVELIRAAVHPQGASLATEVLSRRARGRPQDDALGGVTSPLVAIRGATHLLLGPRAGRKLTAFTIAETVYLREDALLAFDGALTYENGRLAVGDGDAMAMVQLHGEGAVVVELRDEISTLEVTPDDAISVRRELVLGWIGRLVPRAVPISEAPAGQRGLVMFAGDGMVLLDVSRGPSAP
jgi:uncharacterized protein (AIM24 family)